MEREAITEKARLERRLDIRNIAKSFGRNPVLRDISLQIAEGEFLTILGESGSGKTTLLRIIAGFEGADSGEISMAGERLDRISNSERNSTMRSALLALFAIGVAATQVKRFPDVSVGDVLSATATTVTDGSKRYVFGPYLSLSLGFSFGGVDNLPPPAPR